MRYCMICNDYKEDGHKCDPEAEARMETRIEAGRKSHENRSEYPKLYGQRLADGFRMMSGDHPEWDL